MLQENVKQSPFTTDVYRNYKKEWYDRHPEKRTEYRANTYINFLKRLGYTVIPPKNIAGGTAHE